MWIFIGVVILIILITCIKPELAGKIAIIMSSLGTILLSLFVLGIVGFLIYAFI